MEGAYDCSIWEQTASREKWLTIGDITSMAKDQTLRVLVLDRNVFDIACSPNVNAPNARHTATHFFRKNLATYKHDGDLKGFIIWDSFEDGMYHEFEFHIMYKPGRWYPLKNGKLPEQESQGVFDFGQEGGKHFTKFDTNTPVGWRGPMIAWSEVSNLPDIYWSNP
jgi:hypothetical protein